MGAVIAQINTGLFEISPADYATQLACSTPAIDGPHGIILM
jgi:hypothetical protein